MSPTDEEKKQSLVLSTSTDIAAVPNVSTVGGSAVEPESSRYLYFTRHEDFTGHKPPKITILVEGSADRAWFDFVYRSTQPFLLPSPDDQPPEAPSGEPQGARAYPHLVEAAAPALEFLRDAARDASAAVDAFSEPDLSGVSTRLKLIAGNCAAAYPFTEFNESFALVVDFIRRATLIADTSELTLSGLQSLLQALNKLVMKPFLDLDEAGEITADLSDEGWVGEHSAVAQLLALLVDAGVQPERDETAMTENKE